jgi:hypothetical protein
VQDRSTTKIDKLKKCTLFMTLIFLIVNYAPKIRTKNLTSGADRAKPGNSLGETWSIIGEK